MSSNAASLTELLIRERPALLRRVQRILGGDNGAEDVIQAVGEPMLGMVNTAQWAHDLDVPQKMDRLRQWCEDVNRVQSDVNYGFVYVDEESFDKYKPKSFGEMVDSFTEYKGKG